MWRLWDAVHWGARGRGAVAAFRGVAMTTLAERMHAAAEPYLTGWRYGRTPRVEWPWPRGVKGPALAGAPIDREIDCSTLTASLLMAAYPEARWTAQQYADLQVFDARRPASPMDAVVAVGVGEQVADFAAERWHLVQGWRRLPGHPKGASGHAIIVYDRGTGVLDVLESSSLEMIGPRWRTTTAEKLREEFPAALYLARLRDP